MQGQVPATRISGSLRRSRSLPAVESGSNLKTETQRSNQNLFMTRSEQDPSSADIFLLFSLSFFFFWGEAGFNMCLCRF